VPPGAGAEWVRDEIPEPGFLDGGTAVPPFIRDHLHISRSAHGDQSLAIKSIGMNKILDILVISCFLRLEGIIW
jgi:hypothetical protein